MSTAYAEIQPPIFQQSVADMSVAHLSPDECQTIEYPCRYCGHPVVTQIPYELPDDLKGLEVGKLAGLVVHDACFSRQQAVERAQLLAAKCKSASIQFGLLCPPEFNVSINFQNQSCSRARWEQVMAHDFSTGRGLVLKGRTQKCKTRFAWALVRREMESRGSSVVAMTHPEFRRDLAAFATEAGRYAVSFITLCTTADIFFLDDLGRGRITEASEEALEDIVDCRVRNHRPLLFTSNETNESLRARLTDNRGPRLSGDRADALLRRIWEFCDVIEF